MKSTISEIKNVHDGITNRLDMAKKKILCTQSHSNTNCRKWNKKREVEKKDIIFPYKNIKQSNIHIIGAQDKKKKKKGMDKNKIWGNNSQLFSKFDLKKLWTTSRLIIKLLKTSDKKTCLKQSEIKNTHSRNKKLQQIFIRSYASQKNIINISQVLEVKNSNNQPRILCQVNVFFFFY